MNIFLNEYSGFCFELNHILNKKMNFQNGSARAIHPWYTTFKPFRTPVTPLLHSCSMPVTPWLNPIKSCKSGIGYVIALPLSTFLIINNNKNTGVSNFETDRFRSNTILHNGLKSTVLWYISS